MHTNRPEPDPNIDIHLPKLTAAKPNDSLRLRIHETADGEYEEQYNLAGRDWRPVRELV